jgi:hypothetical protein
MTQIFGWFLFMAMMLTKSSVKAKKKMERWLPAGVSPPGMVALLSGRKNVPAPNQCL